MHIMFSRRAQEGCPGQRSPCSEIRVQHGQVLVPECHLLAVSSHGGRAQSLSSWRDAWLCPFLTSEMEGKWHESSRRMASVFYVLFPCCNQPQSSGWEGRELQDGEHLWAWVGGTEPPPICFGHTVWARHKPLLFSASALFVSTGNQGMLRDTFASQVLKQRVILSLIHTDCRPATLPRKAQVSVPRAFCWILWVRKK